MKSIRLFTITIMTASLMFSCSGGSSSNDAMTGQNVVNNTGGNSEGNGVSSIPEITVKNGTIVVDVTDGRITIDGDNVQLTQQSGGDWQLADGVTITVTDNNGNTITGTIGIDQATGDITFTPSDPLDVSATYTVTVTVNGVEYSATVIVSVDDTQQENSLFASVPLRSAGTFAVSDLIVNGKALFGWAFGSPAKSFSIRLANIDAGATVYLTAYGIYDIAGHQNEVYYQRWESDQTPVKDFVWSGFTITVNEQDSSIDGANGDPDYSFATTYIELRVMKDGADITATSSVQVIVQ